MDSDETVDGNTGGFRECDTPNAFPPLVHPAIFLYHLVEYVMFSYHSVTFEIVLCNSFYPVVAWQGVGLRGHWVQNIAL